MIWPGREKGARNRRPASEIAWAAVIACRMRSSWNPPSNNCCIVDAGSPAHGPVPSEATTLCFPSISAFAMRISSETEETAGDKTGTAKIVPVVNHEVVGREDAAIIQL